MDEYLSEAGQFEIEHCILLTSEGLEYDLSKSVAEIQFYESIYASAVSGSITLFDTFALSNIAPLIGQEYLRLKIRTPTIIDDNDKVVFMDNVLHINRITRSARVGNRAELNTLQFTTSEFVHNQRILISRSLKGTCSSIVEDLLVNDLNCKKDLYIEDSVGVKKFIAPNTHPFTIVEMMSKQAISKTNASPSYLFYETFRGYHFRSLESLYAQGPVFRYSDVEHSSATVNPSNPRIDANVLNTKILRDMSNINNYQMAERQDSLTNTMVGGFSSQLIEHDVFNKSYTSTNYNYFDDRGKHINYYHGGDDYPLYNDVVIDKLNRRITDFSPITFLSPTSNIDSDTNAQYTESVSPTGTPDWLQKRRSMFTHLETSNCIDIDVYGNTFVSAGDVVNLSITKRSPLHPDDQVDRFYRGAFLIKKVAHSFSLADRRHTMLMELCKDSSSFKYEKRSSHAEIKPTNVGNRITQFYNRGGGIRR